MTASRSGRLKAAFLRLVAVAMAAALYSGLALGEPPPDVAAGAGEAATSHRAGDLIVYRFACHEAEDMIAIAERARPPSLGGQGGANELAAVLVREGKCFQNRTCIAARLEAWIAGPFPPPRGAPGSVWRVRDQFGDIEFVWINDRGGRHAARREMAL